MGEERFLIILNHSLYVRNFVASGFLEELAKESRAKLFVLVDERSFGFLPKSDLYELINLQAVLRNRPIVNWVRDWFREFFLVQRSWSNPTYATKVAQRKQGGLWSNAKFSFLVWLSKHLDLEQFSFKVEHRLIPTARWADRFYDRVRPTKVFYASVIFDQLRYLDLIKAGKKRGIPLYAFVASWDNLTSKGAFLVRPDHLFVWGEADRRHAKEEHGFQDREISVTGTPQFDCYFEPDPSFDRARFLQERGLDPKKKTILFVGTTRSKIANEPQIVRSLLGALQEKDSGFSDTQIWYRPHPRMDPAAVKELRNIPGLFFDDQVLRQHENGRSGYSVSPEDKMHYPRMLASIDLVISAFSTMIVEAALFGKPSVVIRFALGAESGDKFLQDNAKFKHVQQLLAWEYVYMALSLPDCLQAVKHFLSLSPDLYGDILRRQAGEIANNPKGPAQKAILSVLTLPLG